MVKVKYYQEMLRGEKASGSSAVVLDKVVVLGEGYEELTGVRKRYWGNYMAKHGWPVTLGFYVALGYRNHGKGVAQRPVTG